MNTITDINDSVLQELVCGGLAPERYRQIVLSLEANPTKWRDCGLAFLQEQAIAEEISQIATSDVDWTSACPPPEVRDRLSNGAGLDRCRPLPMQSLNLSSRETSNQNSRAIHFTRRHLTGDLANEATDSSQPSRASKQLLGLQRATSLAALLLIGFTVGWIGSGMQRGEPLLHQPAAPQPVAQNVSATGRGTEANGRPEEDEDAWLQTLRFADDRFLPIDREVPRLLRQLEREGRVRIESVDGFMPMQLDDGAAALVPVQQFTVVPVVYSY